MSKRDARADLAVRFVNNLTHTKGGFARQPFNLRKWQERIVRQLFTTNAVTGLRQYRSALLMLPRKNGKTELAAAIALYGLLADGELGGEVYSAAADRDQASLVFNVAAQMVRNDPELDAVCEIVDSQKRIVHRRSGSVYRAISSEAHTKHGFNASMVIYDELHAAPNRELWDVLTTSMGARAQPLVFAISTAGYDRNSILYELYAHAKRVVENPSIDPTFLPMIYEIGEDEDWTDEQVWRKANPALGDFRSLEDMRIAFARAKEIPAQQNTFRRLFLNQWTEQAERWLDLALWDQGGAPLDVDGLQGQECFAGLDLASTRDVTALVLAFPSADGVRVLPIFWVPEDTMRARVARDRVPYDEWVKAGLVRSTPGNVCDYDRVRADIQVLAQQYQIREIGYDKWNATQLVTQLVEDGAECVPISQRVVQLTAATKELDKLVASGRLHHGGHPVLRWMAGNVAIEQDHAGNIKPSKRHSTEKIDGISALVMALDRLIRSQGDASSVWEDPDYEMVAF